MEIDEQHLKDSYQAEVQSALPGSRRGCPQPKALLKLLRSRLTARKAARLIDHLSGCGYCADEFRFLIEALRQEKRLIREAERNLAAEKTDARKEQALRGARESVGRWRPDFRRLSWSSASLLAGLAVVCLAAVAFLVFRSQETYRSDSGLVTQLTLPVDQKVSRSSLVFKWEPVEGSEHYSFELFDRTLGAVWKDDEVRASELVLPEEAARKLVPGSVFFWMVTAHLPGGETQPSRLEKFALEE